jgi:hypothetical protein
MSVQQKQYDLNVPLSSTSAATPSSISWKRRQLAHIYTKRLHQLGYHGVSFCHTAYGRLDAKQEDADVNLPWRDLMSDTDGSTETSTDDSKFSFGKINSLGMQVYRRLNIIVEEGSDVSRILLPSTQASGDTSYTELFQKYDIISLQPMNEPALQNICELLTNDTISRQIDILVLEYATGARGGFGLPYKIRKEYALKVMEAGVTFELCYGTAMIDPKRRQGFLRTMIDFQTNYNSIQKKHLLLNKHIGPRHDGLKCKSDKLPLLLSSGARQNYSQGTDEGMLALRSPHDVRSAVGHLSIGGEWLGSSKVDGEDDHVKANKKKQMVVLSAAEKVLTRARDRSTDVVVTHQNKDKKRKRGFHAKFDIRAHVQGLHRSKQTKGVDDEDKGIDSESVSSNKGSTSLVDWLSEAIMTANDTNEKVNVVEATKVNNATETTKETKLTHSKPFKDASNNNESEEKDDDTDDEKTDGYLAF